MRIDEKQAEQILHEVDVFCARLMELGCDSVQMVATAHREGDCWGRLSRGKGNLYARFGAVQEWMEEQRNIGLSNELEHLLDHESNEGEEN